MQRWEYRVISLPPGHYTDALNEYGREGWELVGITSETREAPTAERSGTLPLPRAFGRLEDAAAKLNKLGTGEPPETEADTPSTVLLWVLRRPLSED